MAPSEAAGTWQAVTPAVARRIGRALLSILATCPAFGCQTTTEAEPVFEILDELVVPGTGHQAFPWVSVLDLDRLAVVFRAGTTHEDPSGAIRLATYHIAGDSLRLDAITDLIDTEMDDRDPAITVLRGGGDIVVTFFSRTPRDNSVPGIRLSSIRSSDAGRAWEPRVDLDSTGDDGWVAARSAALELPDGDLLLATYGQRSPSGRSSAFAYRSADRGRQWVRSALIADGEATNVDYLEPVLSSTGGLGVLAVFRTGEVGLGFLYQAFSENGGASWGPAQKLDVWGYPPHVLSLGRGRAMLTYGYRQHPYGVRFRLGPDTGDGWNPQWEGILESGSETIDCCYPSATLLADESIVVAYYVTTGDRTAVKLLRIRL